ncbi:MAG: L-seryl-tRNA(Sec) selenium transferase [Desulfobulbaceae bacterium A2]|nr:MAG: L-seryl-tRNA(Sec) selenium transferase [Desulfobulbaceae bacterium A2]
MQALLSHIPKVDECLSALQQLGPEVSAAPRSLLRRAVREVLEECRQKIRAAPVPAADDCSISTLLPRFLRRIESLSLPRFRRVINGTGVVIHTNLGRSLLPRQAIEPLIQAAARYGNLEFDLDSGRRGSRYSLVEDLLCELTGAEAALVVNNNAAAVLLALEALARGREVIVSRGQLVEIGGSFRIPDVMARSGAVLVEVGATNRTHLRDYEAAIRPETGLLLRVHNSNYRIIGFTSEVAAGDLVALGARHGLPVMEDLGSGCFVDLSRFGLAKEPTVQETVRAGVDVVTFSGDKLLGGPQAGIILGRRALIDQVKKNPLNRALRIDKFTLASLEAVLRLYRDEASALAAIPTLAMIASPVPVIERRARRLTRRLGKRIAPFCDMRVCDVTSRVGGGALPEQNLPSRAVALVPRFGSVQRLEESLRRLRLPVIGRIENEQLLLDMRTVADDELGALADCLVEALASLSSKPAGV